MKKRKRVLLFLFLLSLIGISFYGGTVSYGFFFGVLLVPVISLSYLIYVYIRFRLYQEIGSRIVVCGEAVPYYFVLQNDDFIAYTGVGVKMFPDFSEVEKMPEQKEYALLPGDRYQYETKLTCKYRGEYEVGVKEIVLTDFFGLFHLTYKVPSAVKAVVSPRIPHVKELKSIPEITAFLQSAQAAEQTEIEGTVRDYVAGDSPKRIHFKASAKEQKLKVRVLAGEEKQGVTILCDTERKSAERKEYLPLENQILEIWIALCCFFAGKNTGVRNFYIQNGIKEISVSGMRDFEQFYRGTCSLAFQKEHGFAELLKETSEKGLLGNSKAVFLISHETDEEILRILDRLEGTGLILVWFVVTNRDISSYQKMSSTRKKIIAVPTDCRVEEVL